MFPCELPTTINRDSGSPCCYEISAYQGLLERFFVISDVTGGIRGGRTSLPIR